MESLTERQKALVESGLRVVWGEAARFTKRGLHISDEAISDAHWELIRAAQRHEGDGDRFQAYAGVWVRGALRRAFKKAKRHSNKGKGTEEFELFADGSDLRTDTVDETEESTPDLQWTDFSDDATGDFARKLRLLRIGIAQIDGVLKPVAEAMAEGLGIRRICDRLGLSFHEGRAKYDEVLFLLRSTLGASPDPKKCRPRRRPEWKVREQIGIALDRLSEDLKPVAAALAEGIKTKEIAEKLGLSQKTIRSMAEKIRRIARGVTAGSPPPTPAPGFDLIEAVPFPPEQMANEAELPILVPAGEKNQPDPGAPIEPPVSDPSPSPIGSGRPPASNPGSDLVDIESGSEPLPAKEEEPGAAPAAQPEATDGGPAGDGEPVALDPAPPHAPAASIEPAPISDLQCRAPSPMEGISDDAATVPLTDRERALVESAMPYVWSRIRTVASRGRYLSDEAVSDAFWGVICAARQHVQHGRSDETFLAFASRWAEGGIFRSSKNATRFRGCDMDMTAARDRRANRTLTVSEADLEGKDLAWTELQDPGLTAFARKLRLLRIALSRIEGELVPVAEAMAEGLGIRQIRKRLGVTFSYARTRYNRVMRKIKETIGLERPKPPRSRRRNSTSRLVAEMLAQGLDKTETAKRLGITVGHAKMLRARIRRENAARPDHVSYQSRQ